MFKPKVYIVGIGYSAPFLQKIESDIELIDLKNIRKLISYKDYLLPSTSILNSIISLILTYFTGPVGLVFYWFIRIFFAKKISFND